jgi:hypothetical protein
MDFIIVNSTGVQHRQAAVKPQEFVHLFTTCKRDTETKPRLVNQDQNHMIAMLTQLQDQLGITTATGNLEPNSGENLVTATTGTQLDERLKRTE